MGLGKLKLIMLLLAGIVFYAACRKIDFRPEKEREKVPADERFFTRNISSNPLVQSLAAYMKRRNEKDSFVNTTVSRIGYPRWDKAFMKGGQLLGRGYSDSSIIIYVPFVRENENFTNASLVAEISPADTTFSYLCDWQFHQKEYGLPGLNNTAEAHALFFMYMDNQVFGHRRFKITDDSLFETISFVKDSSLRYFEFC